MDGSFIQKKTEKNRKPKKYRCAYNNNQFQNRIEMKSEKSETVKNETLEWVKNGWDNVSKFCLSCTDSIYSTTPTTTTTTKYRNQKRWMWKFFDGKMNRIFFKLSTKKDRKLFAARCTKYFEKNDQIDRVNNNWIFLDACCFF